MLEEEKFGADGPAHDEFTTARMSGLVNRAEA